MNYFFKMKIFLGQKVIFHQLITLINQVIIFV
jgi:hypothetical protein